MTKMMLMAAVALGLATAPVMTQSGSERLNLAGGGSERLNLADNGSSGSERIAEGEFHSERLASRAPADAVLA
jgi:hypothetical protein